MLAKPLLAVALIDGRVRAFQDLRRSAIPNDTAAGANPDALMTKRKVLPPRKSCTHPG
jgi:hypothetical protein